MVTITPFLMFQGSGAEAADFYADLFPRSDLVVEQENADGEPMLMTLTIGGQQVRLLDSPPMHGFDFTPTFSFYVECADASEVDHLHDALSEGGKALMPLDSYPFSPRYCWVTDRFGVSWQVGVPAA
ncbi:VOC family protein [Pseudooceanicola aestuarii]|uniref:VOC family protein n=1 Tax=Pseudooceanicola aestuarii TaxID=2697319 RepID=UPI001952B2D1|nr:VOC family protein [Pseudooceanicola aestuarii]